MAAAPDLEGVWSAFGAELRRFIAARVSAPAVDDVVQETLLRVHRGLAGVEDPLRLRAWLLQVARSAIADHHRRAGRSREAPGEEDAASRDLPDRDTGDEDANENATVLAWLRPFISALEPHYREALELVELEGLTQAEAARRLGVPVPTLKARVQRGRRKLRALMEACCRLELDSRGNVIDWERRNRCAC